MNTKGVPYIRTYGRDWLVEMQALSPEERGVIATISAITSIIGGRVTIKPLPGNRCLS